MVSKSSDELVTFVPESAVPPQVPQELEPWKLLVVDDDQEVHVITGIVLRDFVLDGAGITIFHAYSAAEAREILSTTDDIASVLLDVVMETEDAGLKLVSWIREELGNKLIRIILRTGQPGAAPEKKIITDYEINDYKAKTEITDIKLYTAITVAIRGYRDLKRSRLQARGFEHLLAATGEVFRNRSVSGFFRAVLSQLLFLLRLSRQNSWADPSGFVLEQRDQVLYCQSASGIFHSWQEAEISARETSAIAGVDAVLHQVRAARGPVFAKQFFADYFHEETENPVTIVIFVPDSVHELDRELLLIFSANVSIAYRNASLSRFIEHSQQEIIYTLGDVVESRSHETGNHVRRVGEFSALLAKGAGLSRSEQENIRLASPMHDIGKIGIPDEILMKPGKLTDEEREQVRRHTDIGYSILKNAQRGVLQTAAVIAWTHHERWDGQGYPRGLAGNDIPLEGRIVAIADVFDALTHKRSYKEAWAPDEAFTYLIENAGSQFDPELVRHFLNARDQVLQILKAHGE